MRSCQMRKPDDKIARDKQLLQQTARIDTFMRSEHGDEDSLFSTALTLSVFATVSLANIL